MSQVQDIPGYKDLTPRQPSGLYSEFSCCPPEVSLRLFGLVFENYDGSFHDNSINSDIILSWQKLKKFSILDDKGMAKAYQVKQVLKAIERVEAQENVEE